MSGQPQRRLFVADSMAGSLSLYLPATAITRLIGLARGMILPHLIPASAFGLFQLAILAINVLNPLCNGGLYEGLARYVPEHEARGTLGPWLRRALTLAAVVTIACVALVMLAAGPLGYAFFATLGTAQAASADAATCRRLMYLAGLGVACVVAYFLLVAVFKGLRMFRAVSLMELGNNVGFTGLTILLAWLGWKSAGAMTLCYVAALVSMIVLFAGPLAGVVRSTAHAVPQITVESDQLSLRPLATFSIWSALAAVTWQTMQYYPMLHLQKVQGAEVTAVFSAVRLVTQMILIGAVSIVAVVQTAVTRTWVAVGHEEADRQLNFAHKLSGLAMLAGCIGVALFARPIMRVFPANYAAGAEIFGLSLMFFLIGGHLSFLAVHFVLIERSRHMFWPWLAGIAVNVAAAFLMVNSRQGPAAAMNSATWAGVLGVTAALSVSLGLAWIERRPIDRGVLLLVAASALLVLPAAWMLGGLTFLVAAFAFSRALLTAADRERVDSLRRRFLSRGRSS